MRYASLTTHQTSVRCTEEVSVSSQVWRCHECYDTEHHEPGDYHCTVQALKNNMVTASNSDLMTRLRKEVTGDDDDDEEEAPK